MVNNNLLHAQKNVIMRRMKTLLSVITALGGALATQASEMWTIRMPETYILPSYAKATYISRMGERHGNGSHLSMQEYSLNVPIVDGRKSHVGLLHLNLQGNATVTVMDVGGGLDLHKDELFLFSLPATAILPLSEDDRIMFTAMPYIASDGMHPSRGWDLALVADYYSHHSDTLSYNLGIASAMRLGQYVVMPHISFSWQMTPEWMLRLHNSQIAALYTASTHFKIGPALSNEGGCWMVDTPIGQRVFRVRSLATCLLAEYDFTQPGKNKRAITAAVGMTLATTAEFCQRTLDKDRIEAFHYKPGVVVSMGMDFRF